MRFLSLILVIFTVAQASPKSSVKISVYYETLCPDCIAFITKQLHPNYKLFGDQVINLELIPYGNAKTITDANGIKSFQCQHGPKECFGNEFHGCVVELYSANVSESFVACAENSMYPTSELTFMQCAKRSGILWDDLKHCYTDGKAFDIMAKNGLKTQQIPVRWVPTIVFNEKFDEVESKQAEVDLKTVICRYLNNQPDTCKSMESELTLIVNNIDVDKTQFLNEYSITVVE